MGGELRPDGHARHRNSHDRGGTAGAVPLGRGCDEPDVQHERARFVSPLAPTRPPPRGSCGARFLVYFLRSTDQGEPCPRPSRPRIDIRSFARSSHITPVARPGSSGTGVLPRAPQVGARRTRAVPFLGSDVPMIGAGQPFVVSPFSIGRNAVDMYRVKEAAKGIGGALIFLVVIGCGIGLLAWSDRGRSNQRNPFTLGSQCEITDSRGHVIIFDTARLPDDGGVALVSDGGEPVWEKIDVREVIDTPSRILVSWLGPKPYAKDMSSCGGVYLDNGGQLVVMAPHLRSYSLVKSANGSPTWVPVKVIDHGVTSPTTTPWMNGEVHTVTTPMSPSHSESSESSSSVAPTGPTISPALIDHLFKEHPEASDEELAAMYRKIVSDQGTK